VEKGQEQILIKERPLGRLSKEARSKRYCGKGEARRRLRTNKNQRERRNYEKEFPQQNAKDQGVSKPRRGGEEANPH